MTRIGNCLNFEARPIPFWRHSLRDTILWMTINECISTMDTSKTDSRGPLTTAATAASPCIADVRDIAPIRIIVARPGQCPRRWREFWSESPEGRLDRAARSYVIESIDPSEKNHITRLEATMRELKLASLDKRRRVIVDGYVHARFSRGNVADTASGLPKHGLTIRTLLGAALLPFGSKLNR
ncbi:hypothetical protein BC628DRAFT_1339675 [Trametes gibbosa]|nr:hypothetical protein BC628DRAFT_1339675 [Trametes gibbosa]